MIDIVTLKESVVEIARLEVQPGLALLLVDSLIHMQRMMCLLPLMGQSG
jgi:hypothetical protein